MQKDLDALASTSSATGCTTLHRHIRTTRPDHRRRLKEGNIGPAPRSFPATGTSRARVHGSIKANFLMSPPLVVAYAPSPAPVEHRT